MNRVAPPRRPLDPETQAAVSKLNIAVRRVVEGLQGGAHASAHLGASVEFAEHKKYSPGDDIRHLDWRALARTDRHYVKQHQKEVVLRCLSLIDRSASMNYRGARARASKFRCAVELVAAVSHIVIRQGDEAGLLVFDDGVRKFLPPGRRPDHLTAVMTELALLEPADGGSTSYGPALAQAAECAGRRAMIIVAGDLWGCDGRDEVFLKQLSARGHDVAVFHVLDPDEIDLPFERPGLFRGLEGEPEVELEPALVRDKYREEVAAFRGRWKRLCAESGIDFLTARTDRGTVAIISEFVTRRRRRRRR